MSAGRSDWFETLFPGARRILSDLYLFYLVRYFHFGPFVHNVLRIRLQLPQSLQVRDQFIHRYSLRLLSGQQPLELLVWRKLQSRLVWLKPLLRNLLGRLELGCNFDWRNAFLVGQWSDLLPLPDCSLVLSRWNLADLLFCVVCQLAEL